MTNTLPDLDPHTNNMPDALLAAFDAESSSPKWKREALVASSEPLSRSPTDFAIVERLPR